MGIMDRRSSSPSLWGIGLLLFCVFCVTLVGYLVTLTQVHTFDALSYVLDVDRKPWQELFHPHHLAYGPLGALVRQVGFAVGYTGSVLVSLQVVNAIAGAAGVTLFAALIFWRVQRVDVALTGALLLGSSYAYWYYAIEVEVYTIAALLLVGALWLMLRVLRQPSVTEVALLGVVHGGAALFHQTNVLLGVPIGLTLLLAAKPPTPPTAQDGEQSGGRGRLWLQLALAYAMPFVLIVGGSYALVALGISRFGSFQEFWEWLTAYAHTGWWGEPITPQTGQDFLFGVSETLAKSGGMWLWLVLVGIVLFNGKRLVQHYGREVAVLATWLVVYALFFLWWEPRNREFWIASMPPMLLLVALALVAGGKRGSAPIISAQRFVGVGIVGAVGIIALFINVEDIRQRSTADMDIHRNVTNNLAAASEHEDLLLVADQVQALYLDYYESRPHSWSLNQALFASGGDWQQACGQVRGMIEAALARGAAVFLADEVLHPTPDEVAWSDPVLKRFALQQAEVTACFAVYIPYMQPLSWGGSEVMAFSRLPNALEMATGEGWDFSAGRWGWQAERITDERFVDEGWDFLPGVDPVLKSPVMSLDTARYESIEIRMAASAATTATAKFELFFRDNQGLVDMQTAVARTLERAQAPAYHEKLYGISLYGREGWEGVMSGFRFDPIGEGDGGRVRLESVRLVLR